MSSVAVRAEPPSASYKIISAENIAPKEPQPLHRIAEVRTEQGVTLRTVARRTGIDIRQLRAQEDPCADLTLSDLRQWQLALDVPTIDLLVDHHLGLSAPVAQRAKLVKVMKTVMAIEEIVASARIKRLLCMLREQLIDLMPELAEVSAWPNYGSRRPTDSIGKIAESPIPVNSLSLENGE